MTVSFQTAKMTQRRARPSFGVAGRQLRWIEEPFVDLVRKNGAKPAGPNVRLQSEGPRCLWNRDR